MKNLTLPHSNRSTPAPGVWFSRLAILFLALLLGAGIGWFNERLFWIVLAALAGVGLLFLTLRYERFSFYLLVVSLPLAEGLRVDFLPTTLVVFPGILVLIGLVVFVIRGGKKIYVGSLSIGFALLLTCWATLATLFVGSASEARPYWLIFILLFLVPNFLTRKEQLLRALWLLLIPLALIGFYVFFDRAFAFVRGQYVDMEDLHTTRFLIGGKNIIGMWLTVGITIAYYLFNYFRGYPGKQLWLALAGLGMLSGVMATLSIGAAIGLAVVVLGIVWLQPRLMSRLRLLILALFILILVFSGPLADRLQNQRLTTFDSNWGTNRGELWSAGFHTMLDHPFFGIGLDPARRIAMLNYIHSWFIQSWFQLGILVVPHNIFVSVGMETGIPGLLIYLVFLISIFLSLLRIRRYRVYNQDPLIQSLTNILVVALIALWVQGMGLSVHLDKLMWFVMGAAIAMVRIAAWEELNSRENSS